MRLICLIFFCFISIQTAMAVRAYPYTVQVRQPDGTILPVTLHGDEFFHYAATPDGKPVVKGRDGFYYYARYSINGIENTGSRVSAGYRGMPAIGQRHEAVSPETIRFFREKNLMEMKKNGGIPGFDIQQPKKIKILIIPVEFADLRFSVEDPKSHFGNMMNTPGYSENGGTGSAHDYFKANLPALDFSFDITDPVTLSQPYSYYGENDISTPSVISYDIRIREMVNEACRLADRNVDFSQYDNNMDGTADYVFIFFAGYNEAESGDDNAIWPQTNNAGTAGIKLDGVKIGLFSCSSELTGGGIGSEAIPSGIGTFCHEFSHFLGLKDLYDTDHGNGGMSKCLWGTLSVMDTGNYNNYGRTPPYYCAIEREMTGTAEYISAKAGMSISLPPVSTKGEIIKIPTSTKDEYYLVENRQESGWDAYIGGSGMLVYHIDKSGNNVDGITASVRWQTNLINTYSQHECADLVEASPTAGHISQVFFPGQADIKEFSAAGTPAFISWDGRPVGLKFTNITADGNTVSFDIHEDNTEILLVPSGLKLKTYQNKAIAEWECGRPGAYKWGIILSDSENPSATIKDTALITRYTFEDLTPKTEYRCLLYHIGEYNNGDTLAFGFTTSALTSPYPYIALDKRTYSKGDTLDLAINNLTEDISSCMWYINGNRAITDQYIFRSQGEYEIKAILTYSSDGSEEIIRRKITIGTEQENK